MMASVCGHSSPLGRNISPSTSASEVSEDSGMVSEEDLGLDLDQEFGDGWNLGYTCDM